MADGKEWLTLYERTLADVNALADKVRGGGGPGARKYNVERSLAESKKKVSGLAGQLTEMELDPPAFGVGEGELNRRRGLMAQLNKLVATVEDGLSGASSRQRRDLLGGGAREPAQETEITAGQSHAELKQATAQQIKSQDDQLDAVARGVTSLKDLGNAMSGELDLHAALLDDLDKHIDKTDNAFRNNTKRIDVVQEEDGSAAAGCGIMICMLLLLVLIIYLASSSQPCHWLPKAKCPS